MFALVASLLCLALNAFFVAAEFALVKVRVTQVDRALRRGDRRAIATKEVLLRLDRYLSVTQFGITVASLGLGWIAEPAIAEIADDVAVSVRGAPLGRGGHIAVDVVGLGTLTFLHLLLGELVPKFIALRYAEATALNTAIPLRLVNATFRPVLWFLERAQRAVLRLLRIDPEVANEGALTEDEIIGVLAAAAGRDPATRDKQRIVERVLRFGHRPVRQMMVPRVDVVSLPAEASGERAYQLLRQHEFSRVLLVEESLDDVVGYLYAKDLLLDPGARRRTTVRDLQRRVLFVPEMRDGLATLKEMQREGIPFAVVVDEYGGTSGIVSMEDLIEGLVGEIRDELDVEPARVVAVSGEPDCWDVDAQATVDDLREVAGLTLDERWFGEQLGRLVLERLGRVPRMGDIVKLAEDVSAEIVATSRRRIQRLRVRRRPAAAGA